MPIRQIPTQYQASDNLKYETAEQAEQHEAILEAIAKHKANITTSEAELHEVLKERALTGDGKPFDFSDHVTYYYVSESSSRAELLEVTLSSPVMRVEHDNSISIKVKHFWAGEEDSFIPTSWLYLDKANAIRALVKTHKVQIRILEEEIELSESRLLDGKA